MLSFSSLEARVQHYADDEALSLSSAKFLAATNTKWRQLIASRWWAEYTLKDTSLTTVAGQEEYTWPISVGFVEEPYIAWCDSADSDRPYKLQPVVSEPEWDDWFNTSTGTPSVYRRYTVAGVLKIALRWIPDRTGDKILIRGKIEPRPFVATNYSSVNADSASGQAVVNLASTSMLAAGDRVILNEGGAREEQGILLSKTSTTVTLTTNLTFSHTAAQADRVERMTSFMLAQDDEILARLIAADIKAKRGFAGRAKELLDEAQALMPTNDENPRSQATDIVPFGIE